MADRYLLESGSPDGYLLEDGSGVLLLDANPLVSSLTDNFDDNSQAAAWGQGQLKSASTVTTGVTVSETNQRLEVTPNTGSGTVAFSGYLSAARYSLLNDSAFVKISHSAAIPNGQETFLAFGDSQNAYLALINDTVCLLQLVKAGVGFSNTGSFAYSSTTHAWLRLRYDGTSLYLDTATSSASDPPVSGDWTNRITLSPDAAVDFLGGFIALNSGTTFSVTPATARFDGFNTATVGTVTHATTGVLTGPGSTIAGSAVYNALHPTTGVLTGPGSTIAGTAAHIAIHGTSGALTGAGSTIAGSSARTAIHATTGVLTGAGSTIAGVAVYNAKHATSGVLTGPGSVIVGAAAKTRAHATTGALTGPGSTIVGVAVYNAKHTTTGALTGPGSSLAGSAARFRAFATSGVLVGPGSTIVGAAVRGTISTTHATSGALIGQPSIIDGTAARTRLHVTSGVLAGPGAFIFGYDTRSRAHDSSGALLGITGTIFGRTFNGTPQLQAVPVDSDNLVNEPSPPSEDLGAITEPSGQIVNHPPYPAA